MNKCKCIKCLQKGITRLEIIEGSERKYVQWDCKTEFSFQDNGKTLKVFVEDIKPRRYSIFICKKCGNQMEESHMGKRCPKCQEWTYYKDCEKFANVLEGER